MNETIKATVQCSPLSSMRGWSPHMPIKTSNRVFPTSNPYLHSLEEVVSQNLNEGQAPQQPSHPKPVRTNTCYSCRETEHKSLQRQVKNRRKNVSLTKSTMVATIRTNREVVKIKEVNTSPGKLGDHVVSMVLDTRAGITVVPEYLVKANQLHRYSI